MRYITLLPLVLALSGCGHLPSSSSVQSRFSRQNPEAQMLVFKRLEVLDRAANQRYAEFTFRYRNAAGAEREEIWHYQHSIHGWYYDHKEQTK